VVDGAAEIRCDSETVKLDCFETALVAGAAGDYSTTSPHGSATLLRAAIPD
jgi:hypothetical protein